MLKYYLPHIVFFSVFVAVLIPMLYYYRRKNPNPRFRPGAGEMTMVAVVALCMGAGACYMLGNFFRGDQNLSQYLEEPNEGAGWSQGASGPKKEPEDSRFRKRE